VTPSSARSEPRRSQDAAVRGTPRTRGDAERPGTRGSRRGGGHDGADEAREGARDGAREGARRTLLDTIRQLPNYLRLLGGLLVDRRVALLDKALVAGAIAYIVSPLDLVPDFIPFLGQVDDVFLLMASLERLVANAGEDVVYDHWRGDPAEIHALDVRAVLGAATVFLPGGVRTKLVRLVRNRRHRAKV
jgi:uncharacterized membrane protein YkvA (DUF1232 family)